MAIVAITVSCKTKEEEIKTTDPMAGLIKLKEGFAIGAGTKVQIWGTKNFFMGYNPLTVILLDSVNPKDTIKDAHIRFMPMMTMEMGMMPMQHNCPIEKPDEEAPNGLFKGALAFVMATSTSGYWNLDVYVHNHSNGKYGTAKFNPITVDNPTNTSLSIFTSQTADSSKLVLSMVAPTTPKVGVNDIEFTIHRQESMMSWPADSTYTIEILPEMPSMGHGSPNNVNPIHTGNGHYKGKVNFTMTGEWKVNVSIKKNNTVVSKNANFIINL